MQYRSARNVPLLLSTFHGPNIYKLEPYPLPAHIKYSGSLKRAPNTLVLTCRNSMAHSGGGSCPIVFLAASFTFVCRMKVCLFAITSWKLVCLNQSSAVSCFLSLCVSVFLSVWSHPGAVTMQHGVPQTRVSPVGPCTKHVILHQRLPLLHLRYLFFFS